MNVSVTCTAVRAIEEAARREYQEALRLAKQETIRQPPV